MNYEPMHAFAEKHRVPYNELCTALREALAAPMPEPDDYQMLVGGVRWTHCAKHIYDACIKEGVGTVRALYAAPPAAPAVPLTDGMVAHLEQQAFASTNYSPERPLYQHWFRVGVRAGYGIAAAPAPVVRESQPTPRTAGCLMCGHCAATGERVASPAVPLTDADIYQIAVRLWEQGHIQSLSRGTARIFARAIEKAHGIGGGNG